MEESILISIKKMLGISSEDESFDVDIIIHINSVFMILRQMGVGPLIDDFTITDNTAKWSDYLEDKTDLESVKTYVYLKVKMIFDPPINSSIIEAYNKLINELEWRLNNQVDYDYDE